MIVLATTTKMLTNYISFFQSERYEWVQHASVLICTDWDRDLSVNYIRNFLMGRSIPAKKTWARYLLIQAIITKITKKISPAEWEWTKLKNCIFIKILWNGSYLKFRPVVAGYRMDKRMSFLGSIRKTALQVRGMPSLLFSIGSSMSNWIARSLLASSIIGNGKTSPWIIEKLLMSCKYHQLFNV